LFLSSANTLRRYDISRSIHPSTRFPGLCQGKLRWWIVVEFFFSPWGLWDLTIANEVGSQIGRLVRWMRLLVLTPFLSRTHPAVSYSLVSEATLSDLTRREPIAPVE